MQRPSGEKLECQTDAQCAEWSEERGHRLDKAFQDTGKHRLTGDLRIRKMNGVAKGLKVLLATVWTGWVGTQVRQGQRWLQLFFREALCN